MKCPKCKVDNPEDSQFCRKCGTALTDIPATLTSPPLEIEEEPKKPALDFAPGQYFGKRYQIIEEIGRGGMGRVYKALDKELNRTVALKMIKPEISSHPGIVERFKKEIKLASQITQENVCRIHDLGEVEGIKYISMQFIEGENIHELIQKTKRLNVDAAINITEQICQALTAAHKKGVIHRDLKPQNIMIDKKGNAYVMDFGIARSLEAEEVTKPGAVIGTPHYMSPEQAEGKKADARSDIYSLGCIMYEMLTGKPPFEADTSIALIHKHLKEAPKAPSKINPQIPQTLEILILKCLEKDKKKRYQGTTEIVFELSEIETGVAPSSYSLWSAVVSKAKKRKKAMFIGAAIVVLGLVGIMLMISRSRRLDVNPNLVVVAVFENRTGDESLDPIGSMAADWIKNGLSQTGLADIVPRTSALKSSKTVGTKTGGFQDIRQIRSLAEETGAGIVITGVYYLVGKTLQFQAELTDAEQGKLLYALPPVSGQREDPMDAIEALRQRSMGALAKHFGSLKFLAPREQPPTFEAYQEFMAGMELYVTNIPQAIRHLKKATELDPNFISPQVYLGGLYGNIGEYAKAVSIFRFLNQNRERLTPNDRLLLDYCMAYIGGDLAEALRLCRQREKLEPKNIILNYLLGLEALNLNHPQETVDTYAKMKPPENSDDYLTRIWRPDALTQAHHMLGNYKRELKEIRRALKDRPNIVSLRSAEVRALAALGRIEEVKKVIDKSLTMTFQRGTAGDIMREAAEELRAHGHPEAAQQVANRAVEWYQNRPPEEAATEVHRYNLAVALYLAKRWEEAQPIFEMLAKEKPDNIDYRGYLGTLAVRRGDREEALRICVELQGIDRPYLFGKHIYWRACIASLLGERQQAVELLREAFAQGCEYGVYLHRNMDLEPLLDFAPFQELIRPKG